MTLRFRLNGTDVTVCDQPATRTLLDWLREDRGLTGTKEGCNEGDCGACTVIVTDDDGPRMLNACILLLPQLQGKAVRTVEGIAGPDGTLHPVQQAMVDHHGSQCGFCTPGFVVAMACAHLQGSTDHDVQLAGNLCRCTGYAPIARAAAAAAAAPVPDWMRDTPPGAAPASDASPPARPARNEPPDPDHATAPADWGHRGPVAGTGAASLSVPEIPFGGAAGRRADGPPPPFLPRDADALARWYAANPDATLIAGATDVGLWVTKGLRDLGPTAFIAGIDDLRRIAPVAGGLRIGACVTLTALGEAMERRHTSFADLIRRYGSVQVRGAATIGGNIANGSPIGDGPPALIALGATLHLRHGDARRDVPLEEFFLAYGRQDRAPGEFVEAVTIPDQPDNLHCHKLSKRFDQDISAVCGCFNVAFEAGRVASARIAFGGMAGTPARARRTETALIGRRVSDETLTNARRALTEDFSPLSDMRGSAEYRMRAAQGMLVRALQGAPGIAAAVA